jgi:hypothetical protein
MPIALPFYRGALGMNPMTVRRWHAYISLFVAPSVLFFAFTGAFQLFSLHETHGSYRPPELLEKLSSVHKDQVFRLGNHHRAPQTAASAPTSGAGMQAHAATQDNDTTGRSTLAAKAFFLLVAVCLLLSTSLGLWMGLTQMRRKPVAWMLIIAGALIPAALLVI